MYQDYEMWQEENQKMNVKRKVWNHMVKPPHEILATGFFKGSPRITRRLHSSYQKETGGAYMPAHQHCDLFYPLVGDLLGSAIN